MTQKPQHKTTATGSIDYAYYIQASHKQRSRSAHHGLRRLASAIRSLFAAEHIVAAEKVKSAPDGSICRVRDDDSCAVFKSRKSRTLPAVELV